MSLNATNYFVFRFLAADTQLHYGYGAIALDSVATSRTITALAYDSTANVGIIVGATTSIPEPGPASLALLATGATGLVAWRKRRAPQSTAAA